MARITLKDIVDIPYNEVAEGIIEFIRSKVEEAGAKGVVVGVSGGVDSATALFLAVKALGPSKVRPLIMPDVLVTPEEDVEDAKNLIRLAGTEPHIINISPIVDVFKGALPIYESDEADRLPLGNLRARIRMCTLYYYANKLNYLVLGSGDRSEILIGYYTKYGDGGVDILPIGILYKTQVRRLALHLGVPEKVALKPSSPRLWPGQTAEGELGIPYEEIDLILHAIFDRGLKPEEVPEATGVEEWKVKKVLEMHEKSRHKREMPPTPPLDLIARYYKK
ncbi:MAG: NAD+ synthase [Desulfurococcales archaeon]|nr:NAD+ synthase [Desulfurococcales archaeon]